MGKGLGKRKGGTKRGLRVGKGRWKRERRKKMEGGGKPKTENFVWEKSIA